MPTIIPTAVAKKTQLPANIIHMMSRGHIRTIDETFEFPLVEPFFPVIKKYKSAFNSSLVYYKGKPLVENDILNSFRGERPVLDFVIPSLLKGTVGSIVSPGGTGKSMLALQIATSIALGDTFIFGDTLKQGKCLYLAGEDPNDTVTLRLNSMHYTPEQEETIAKNLRIINLPDSGITMDVNEDICPDFVAKIAHNYRIVFLDTLRRFHVSEENSSGDMAILVSKLEKIAHLSGAAIVFLHHTNKSAAFNNGGTDNQQASRGSSVLTDNIRWQSFLSPMSKDESEKHTDILGGSPIGDDRGYFVRYGISKQNYGPPLQPIWLKRGEGGVLAPVKLHNIKGKKVDSGDGL